MLKNMPHFSAIAGTATVNEAPPAGTLPSPRPKSWHGGKPVVNRAVIDEMQNKLAARRAKVQQQRWVQMSSLFLRPILHRQGRTELKSRYGAKNRFQEPSLELSSQAT